MIPMLRELHQARKQRLQRMKAWPNGNVVTLHDLPQPEPEKKPAIAVVDAAEPARQPDDSVTPITNIASPEILEGTAIKIRQIQIVVAKRYRITLDDIKSVSRNQFVMRPRQIAYTLAKRLTVNSYPAIGRAFGRDHTTIMSGVRKIESRASKDATFAAELTQLEWVITGKGKMQLPCPCCGAISEGTDNEEFNSAPTSPNNNSGNC